MACLKIAGPPKRRVFWSPGYALCMILSLALVPCFDRVADGCGEIQI